MSWLRSAYRTSVYSITLGTGAVVPVPIRWYRAPAGALPLPYHHQYDSSNWTRPTRYAQTVGEILSAARPWDNGKTAATAGTNCCGAPHLWTGPLYRLSTPLPSWPNGQPQCCALVVSGQGSGQLDLMGAAGGAFELVGRGAGPLDLAGRGSALYDLVAEGAGHLDLEGGAAARFGRLASGSGYLQLMGSGHASGSGGSGSYPFGSYAAAAPGLAEPHMGPHTAPAVLSLVATDQGGELSETTMSYNAAMQSWFSESTDGPLSGLSIDALTCELVARDGRRRRPTAVDQEPISVIYDCVILPLSSKEYTIVALPQ